MTFTGEIGIAGNVDMKVIRPKVKRASLAWRLRNALRWPFLKGWLIVFVAVPVIKALRLPVMVAYGELSIRVRNGATGEWTDYGTVSRQVITDAAVAFIVDDWDGGANDISLFNYHGIGTGTNVESVTDTALQTESTTALNPNNTRATGVKSQPASNQMRSVGTLTCDADIAVTEHGWFTQAATGGGTLFDRSVFAVINLVGANPDSIQCTYTATLNAGG